jgi:hypothetical protein
MRTTRAAKTMNRAVAQVSGGSLIVVGFIMLALVGVEFRYVGIVLAIAGGVLAVRGLAGAILSLRMD